MQSLAQKKARENFKKAIEYRKKTGCSLKQAFAHVSGKKTVVKKKATPKKVAVKKAAKKVVKKKIGVVKKKAVKKPISTHKDTKSHNVNIKVVSGIADKQKAINTLMLMEKDLLEAIKFREDYKNTQILKGIKFYDYEFKNITQKRYFINKKNSEIKARKKAISEQYKLIKSI